MLLSGTRILIVDGDAARAERLARALEAAGAGLPIRRAGSLREFREAAASASPDIALAALVLPDGRLVEALTDPPEDGPFPVLVLAAPGEAAAAGGGGTERSAGFRDGIRRGVHGTAARRGPGAARMGAAAGPEAACGGA